MFGPMVLMADCLPIKYFFSSPTQLKVTTKSESIASNVNARAVLLREQKAQLEESILQAEMQLESLKAQRVLVEQELSNIVYPVLSLPSELTTRIFALAVAIGVATHDPVLLQLAAVCQQWRAVALDNPGLWQSIAFSSDVSNPEQLFLCFAERSGTLPLHISISIRGEDTWEIPLGILRSSARWKTAHLLSEPDTTPHVHVPTQFSDSLALPLLEELTMNFVVWSEGNGTMLFRDARRLHTLCFSHPVLIPHVGLPTERLKKLEFIRHGTHAELLELLSHTINLEILIFPRPEWGLGAFTGVPLPIYHKLHTLSCISGIRREVLDQLAAPSLHTLHLPGTTNELSATVIAFLTRSGCTLRTLLLQSDTEYETLSMLMRSPALASVSQVTLALQFMSEEEAFDFSSLLGDGTFFPGLKTFTIIVPFGWAGIIEPYLLGVINRTKLVVELESTPAAATSAISRIDEFTLEFMVDELNNYDKQNLDYLAQELGVQVNIPSGFPSESSYFKVFHYARSLRRSLLNEVIAKSEFIASNINAAVLREQKAQLDERIFQAQMQLESLKAQRFLVEQELSKLIFPVLSLPPELTTRVFAFAVATGVADHKPVLLQLAAVCQQWRAVALDNPGLWEYIAFTSDVRAPEQLFLCFAERSRTLPIRLSIFLKRSWEIPLGILHSSARWKAAHFLSDPYKLVWPFLRVTHEFLGSLALPLLEELTMDLVTRQGASEDRTTLLRNAPRLQNLCFGHPWVIPRVGLPTGQLRSLQFIRECTSVELLKLLGQISNLETLILPRVYSAVNDTFTGPPLPIFHNLHTLSSVSGLAPEVIDHLTAPALDTLHLPAMDAQLAARVIVFLTRSGCTLRKLSLQDDPNYEMLSMLLRSRTLASVSHVTLPTQFMSPEDAANFALLLGNGSFLPGLKSFTILARFQAAPAVIEPYLFGVINRGKRVVELQSTSARVARIDEFTLKFTVEALHEEHIRNLEYLGQELGVQSPT
ncbi:hypothetical protein C8F01DRAFT_1260755 [Mycena amicta]|nr:hypothetical protein C8F01DRAFT_1260755 [Mycena amicta]